MYGTQAISHLFLLIRSSPSVPLFFLVLSLSESSLGPPRHGNLVYFLKIPGPIASPCIYEGACHLYMYVASLFQ